MSLSNLPLPPANFRPDQTTRRADGQIRFESMVSCLAEDGLRAQLLRQAARRHPGVICKEAAERLAAKLERGRGNQNREITIASSVDMRALRINVAGALWQLVEGS